MRTTFLATTFVLILFGCVEESIPLETGKKIEDYISFKPGSYWIY